MNDKRGDKKRLCCRPGCGHPAVATLVYSHAEETIIVGPLATDGNPHSWDLCTRHSERFRPPEGWTVIRDEPNGGVTALLETVNDSSFTEGAPGDEHSSSSLTGNEGEDDDHHSVSRLRPSEGRRTTTEVSAAVADIQETMTRLRGARQSRYRYSSTEDWGAYRDVGENHSSAHPPMTGDSLPSQDAEDEDEWECESPLIQAAKERERRRRLWRGRGEEPTVGSSPGKMSASTGRPGRHRRTDSHLTSKGAPGNRPGPPEVTAPPGEHGRGEPESMQSSDRDTSEKREVRHPSLHNIPGRKRGHLHAVPDPDQDIDT